MNTMAEKNTDILLDQALHEIHLTVWSRFINENNLLLDYTELSGNISLPTPDECEQNQPNALGWWSPIENGGFFNRRRFSAGPAAVHYYCPPFAVKKRLEFGRYLMIACHLSPLRRSL